MQDRILHDIARVLIEAKEAVYKQDTERLAKLSDTVIHNASVFQDEDTIEIAIAIYALAKLLHRKAELHDQFLALISHLEHLFSQKQYHAYRRSLKHLLTLVDEGDNNVTKLAKEVIASARVKKGSKLYYHGISVAQSACALGISQWELYNYIGKAERDEDETASVANTRKRLAYTKQLLKQKDNVIVFDAGPVITSAINGLLYSLPEIKKLFNADFLIPQAVHYELIEKPMSTKKHKLEAYHVIKLINNNTLHTVDKKYLHAQTIEYLNLINTTFHAYGNPIKIIHEGEMQALTLLKALGGRTLVVDERTTRYLLETPERVVQRFERRLHTKVTVDKEKLKQFQEAFKDIQPIRSVELYTVALTHGVFADLLIGMPIRNNEKQFYEGLLWGLKLAGCGVSNREISALIRALNISEMKK